MSKATCSRCGYVIYLEGKEFYEIPEAIQFLIDKQKNHECKPITFLENE